MDPTTESGSPKSSTQQGHEGTTDDTLLDRLKSANDARLGAAARQVNHFSEDDDANEKRWTKAETRRTFYKIRRWFFWFLFALTCAMITVCSVGYLYLVYVWVSNLIWGTPLKNTDGVKDIITDVLWTLLVIMATLFGESIFKEKD